MAELDQELLFDANEYHRLGACPWTFFAYPTSLADSNGLPPDEDVCRILVELQRSGLRIAIWSDGTKGTSYIACRAEDRRTLQELLEKLEQSSPLDPSFLNDRVEQLFARCRMPRP